MGWLADRVLAPTEGRWSAAAAGVLMLTVACVQGMGSLMALRFGTSVASDGLDPTLQIWLSNVTQTATGGRSSAGRQRPGISAWPWRLCPTIPTVTW